MHDERAPPVLTDAEARRLHERLVWRATGRGFGGDAEDFAQETLVDWLAGKCRGQTVDQAVVDRIRERYGRPGTPGFEQKHSFARAASIDVLHEAGWEPSAPGFDPLLRLEVEELIALARKPRSREVLRLRFFEGWSESEIATHLGITESGVCQILRRALHEIRTRASAMDLAGRVETETRTCQCGCGSTFRVMKSSTQTFASQGCEAEVTPGGYMAVVQKSAKKRGKGYKPIPAGAEGQISTVELAKMLGMSYANLYVSWIKPGRITPEPSESRNKFYDLAKVREQMAAAEPEAPVQESNTLEAKTRPTPAPERDTRASVTSSVASAPLVSHAPVRPRELPATDPDLSRRLEAIPVRHRTMEELGLEAPLDRTPPRTTPISFEIVEQRALNAAWKVYRRKLREAAEEAERLGETSLQLACLKRYVAVEGGLPSLGGER